MEAVGRKPKSEQQSASSLSVCDALKHPVRVRILEVLCESDISPVEFFRRGCMPPGFDFKGEYKNAISHVSYHFKVLREADCIYVVNTIPRRGANEHIYRSKALALHTDEEFEAMSVDERRAISRTTLQTLIARADSAIYQGTFDERVDRHLSWVALELDEEGWQELRDLQAATLEAAQAIKAAAIARNHEREQSGETMSLVPATFGALAFESPTVPQPD